MIFCPAARRSNRHSAPLHDEHVIAVREEPNVHIEFYKRDVTDGVQSPWKLPVYVVSMSFHEVFPVGEKIENKVQLVKNVRVYSDCTHASFPQSRQS